jgi:FkbM family methyltransferase
MVKLGFGDGTVVAAVLASGQVVSLASYCVRAPRVIKTWPTFMYHELRLRVGKPGHPKASEIVTRDGARLGVVQGRVGLYPVIAEVWVHAHYDRKPEMRIRPDDTVIDIGAQVGYFTIKAARQATSGRVLAFEPCPPHFASLEANIERNSLTNVTAFHEAIWSTAGTVDLNYGMAPGGPTNTSVYDIGATTMSATVPSHTLDEIFEREQIERCGFLKMDCEGAEYPILEGTHDNTLRRIDRIAMEWHRFDPSHEPAALVERFLSVGFTVETATNTADETGYIWAHR